MFNHLRQAKITFASKVRERELNIESKLKKLKPFPKLFWKLNIYSTVFRRFRKRNDAR